MLFQLPRMVLERQWLSLCFTVQFGLTKRSFSQAIIRCLPPRFVVVIVFVRYFPEQPRLFPEGLRHFPEQVSNNTRSNPEAVSKQSRTKVAAFAGNALSNMLVHNQNKFRWKIMCSSISNHFFYVYIAVIINFIYSIWKTNRFQKPSF